MTVKEIAQATGKAERSVRRWVMKASDILSAITDRMLESSPTRPADYTQEETLAIIEAGMGKNAADIYRANCQNSNIPAVKKETDVMAVIATALDRLVRISESQESRIQKIENRIEQRAALLPAPQIKPRDRISKIVREYVSKTGIDYRQAYTELYREFGYRTNTSPTLCAKHRGIKVIDYIEAEGMIETLEAIAADFYAA